MLIVFGGLPGTGKTMLSRLIAEDRRATYLRIDTIEEVLRLSGIFANDVGPSGYLTAYAVAEDNLRPDHDVVADSRNPLGITRAAWRKIATAKSTRIVEIEIVCSDPVEHRRRLEARVAGNDGRPPLDWDTMRQMDYEPWDTPHLVIETAGRTIVQCLAELRARIASADAG